MSRRSFLRHGAAVASVPAFGALLQACGGSGGAGGGGTGALDFWFWAEQDAPGANAFLKESIAAWRQQNGERPDVKVAEQQTDTLVANFQSAAAAHSGPDIASQWATGPILAQAWGDAISPISKHVDAAEIEHWLFRQENEYNGELWAAPLYIIGQPFTYNRKLFAKAGLDP